MYLGSGYPKFYIYLVSGDTEIEASPIELKHFIIERKHETLENENSYSYIAPLTKRKHKKSDGFWWKEQLTICSKNFIGTVIGLNDREVEAATQSEFNKITNLIQYANSPLYYIKYVPHDDAERLLNLTPFECNITVVGQSYQGHKKPYGLTGRINNSGGYAALSEELVVDGLSKTPVAGDEIYFKNQNSKYTVVSYVGTTLTITPGLAELVADDEVFSAETYVMNNDTISIVIESKDIAAAPFLPQPSAAPEWVSPADLAVTGYSVDFEWTQVSTFSEYTLQIATSPGFASGDLVYNDLVSGMEETVASLTEETYYARVRVGATGQWSDTLTFYPFAFNKAIEMNENRTENEYLKGYVDGFSGQTVLQMNLWLYYRGTCAAGKVSIIALATASVSSTMAFNMRITDDDKLGIVITDGATKTLVYTSTNSIPKNQWVCIGFTCDLSKATDALSLKAFYNGTDLAGSYSGTKPTATNATNPYKWLYLGALYDPSIDDYLLDAYIDHIYFSKGSTNSPVNSYYSDDEMKGFYNGGTGRNYPSDAWEVIKLDETSGFTHATKNIWTSDAKTAKGIIRTGGSIVDHS